MRFILNQLDKQDYLKIIRDAIKEDLDGYGDITSKYILMKVIVQVVLLSAKRKMELYFVELILLNVFLKR